MTNRSFVIRQGRITARQERALSELWPRFGIDIAENEMLDFQKIFPSYREVVVEIGFGNGESLLEMAANAPDTGFVGIEVYPPGIGRILSEIEVRDIKNLRILRGDAAAFFTSNFQDETIDRVQVYFPDPWHKLRHHKRRLLQQEFCDKLWKKIKKNGYLHIATDWQNYAESIRDFLLLDAKWKNLGNSEGFIDKPEFRPQTKFEQRGIKKGHGVWDLFYQKV
ncbi:MAG: tRNA (guanosine(46)-N7)-methyltransferase TrmB [Cardiobacteriaceae bacterium]|nr:tRNA (guanosine(46)-N7)-methyltransferase TrmB [Cardiobacteriaceae bacterium]